MLIQDCHISTRTKNALIKNNILTVKQLQETDQEELKYMNGIWEKTLEELQPLYEKKPKHQAIIINKNGISIKNVY